VFAKAREKARTSSCSSNVKQLMLGVLQYTSDFDERLPYSHQTSSQIWWSRISPYVKSDQVYVCPSDPHTGRGPVTWPADPMIPSCSYAPNYGVQGNAIARIVAPSATIYMADTGCLALNVPPYHDPTFKKDNGWILVDPTDVNARSATNWDWCAPMPRHMEMCNTGYVDGHVKCTKPETWYYNNTPWMDPLRGG
jgi:prepilin-type processing-associated H-X9-DG protein